MDVWFRRARTYPTVKESVIDGDTFDVFIDQGFHGYKVERLRLLGVNTPEMKRPTLEAAKLAKAFVISWLEEAYTYDNEWPLIIRTEKDDAFGRYLATVWRTSDKQCLNDLLIEHGLAVVDIRP